MQIKKEAYMYATLIKQVFIFLTYMLTLHIESPFPRVLS